MAIYPRTPEQWQEAVDCAHVMLAIDVAQSYGFVTGFPDMNTDRCLEILEDGKRLGYTPAQDAIERFIREQAAT